MNIADDIFQMSIDNKFPFPQQHGVHTVSWTCFFPDFNKCVNCENCGNKVKNHKPEAINYKFRNKTFCRFLLLATFQYNAYFNT